MAFSSHFRIISALLICLCSAEVTSETTMDPEPTVPTGPVTSEITMDPEPTAQTESETSLPTETTSKPEPTVPTGPVTSESGETTSAADQSSTTDTVTSKPGETTMLPETTGSTDVETSVPTQTTSVIEPTNTVTSESVHTTSTETSTVTPSSLPTDPPNTLPTTQPTIPSTKPPTDPPTTPPATATTQTTKCQNGGYFNGSSCICPVGFGGEVCQYLDTVEPDTLNRSVVVNLQLKLEFNDKYEDKTSSEYKEFVQNFTNQIKTYYVNIANFQEVVVTSVSRGDSFVRLSDKTVEKVKLFKQSAEAMAVYSITPRAEGVSVTHDVVLAIPNDVGFNQLYDNDFTAVQKAVDELVGCTGDCPYNFTAQPVVNRTELDLGSLCKTLVDENDVAEYEAVPVNGVIRCVNLCDILHSTPKTCNYMGTCAAYSNIGPVCHCKNIDSTWYLGNDCSFPIQRIAFYVGLSVTLACLLVTVGALTARLLCNKRNQTLRRDVKNQQVNQWLTEDFQWSRPNSFNDTLNAGEYKNPSFTHEESAIHREMPSVYRRPAPVYQLNGPYMDTDSRQWSPSEATYPSSQTVYGHNRPFSDAGLSSLNLRDFSSKLMRINRPQIRTS